jgi:hypothetical protein
MGGFLGTILTPSRSFGREGFDDPSPNLDRLGNGTGGIDALEEELDHGMILTDRWLTPPSRLLSPHYHSSSPMMVIRTAASKTAKTVVQPVAKTVVVEAATTGNTSSSSAPPRRFTVDQVLPPAATQQHVYGSVGDVRDVFRGYNVTILAYGQTSSGKTYTMMGGNGSNPPRRAGDDAGVIPLAVRDLFTQELPYTSVHLSCMEIYQDELKDLLVEQASPSSLSKQGRPGDLRLRDGAVRGAGGGVRVEGLTLIKVVSAAQVLDLLSAAQDRRRTGSTRLNERSSRSHMITTLAVKNASVRPPVTAKLTLVDLAGSERIKQTEVVGSALGESIHINTDLFTLGKVVNALCEKSPHVPYRDSKLTRLLKDALGGNCSTTLICCVSPSDLYLEESINTLRYAERSRSITNSLEKNVVSSSQAVASPYEVAELRAENKRLRAQIRELQGQIKGPELQSLMEKVQRAKDLGSAVREDSQLVTLHADRLREQVIRAQQQAANTVSSPSSIAAGDDDGQSLLEYELSFGDDEDSLVDPSDDNDDDSLLGSADNAVPANAKSLKVEVRALAKEKKALKEMMLDVSNQIEAKRFELEQLQGNVERETRSRDELAVEVSQMKHRLHLLATGESEPAPGLLGLLRRSSSAAADGEGSEVEMRTMKVKETESMKLARELAKSLGEERTRGEELENKCREFQLAAEQARSDNEALTASNQSLQAELKRLRGMLSGKVTPETASPTSSDDSRGLENHRDDEEGEKNTEAEEGPKDSQRCESSSEREGPHTEMVKSKVREILLLAGGVKSAGTCGSMVSSLGTELLPDATDENDSPGSSNQLNRFFISNMNDATRCTCEAAMFSSNLEHVDFYLPILGVSCTCGKQKQPQQPEQSVSAPLDPCALEFILRPWQVEFLNSVGITGAVEFVHAFTQRGAVLATQMRKWRRQKGMLSVKTKSCRVALHIWHRTCKSVIRYVREQQARGVTELQRPDFLEITIHDDATISTLGGGSACNKQALDVSTISL